MLNNIFEQLNERQIEAVTSTEGYLRIIAGAGSGKTKTLTHRYAYLVQAAGIHPSNVLCVTFTNKASGEMKRRVRRLIGDGYDNSLITTYHGFCVRVLRDDIGRLFYPQNFPIMDEGDQKKILEEIYAEMELKLDSSSFEKILDSIHYLKSHEDYVDRLISRTPADVMPQSLEDTIIQRYFEKQKKTFSLDFDDLISFTFALFDRFPDVISKWQQQLHYIQVDEFQDSSFRELKLIKLLASNHNNLFVVGDPDQNIYEWRGATMEILVDFDKTFPNTQTVLLNQNYRSTEKILNAANILVRNNKNRIPKDLYTKGSVGDDVIHLHAKSEEDEGKWIANEIIRLVKNENYSFKDIALLYRSGFLSRFLEQSLMGANIPYELYGSLKFYHRMEIRDCLAYLKLIIYNDDSSLERVINKPRRLFGKAKMAFLRDLASRDGLSLYETLQKHIDLPDFQRSGAGDFLQVIANIRCTYHNMPLSEIIQTVLTESGYERYIRENGSMERLDNLAEFKRTALDSERSYGEFFPLDLFLQQIMIQADRDESGEETDKVKLMTIHASKGLEFPVCFVCALTDGIFPSGRTIEERKEAGLEEERRLCFVALTRAMKRLYLTESEGNSSDRQSTRRKLPSRFIFEIGEQNYTRIGTLPKELEDELNQNTHQFENQPAALAIGSTVNHPVFGRGTIISTDEYKRTYGILFEKTNSIKPVSMNYNFDAWQSINEMRENALKALTINDSPKSTQDTPVQPPEPLDSIVEFTDADQEIINIPQEPKTIQKPFFSKPEQAIKSNAYDNLIDVNDNKKPAMPSNEPVDVDYDNLWKRSDVPHDGWSCTDVIDLGEPVGTCKMCGHQIIRYVHIMMHPEYPRVIGAGCVCAGKMEGDVKRARDRENAFKNRLARIETFLKIPLKRSRNGNEYIKYKNEIITVIKDKFKEGNYKTAFRNNFSSSHQTKEDALLDAFNIIDPGEGIK